MPAFLFACRLLSSVIQMRTKGQHFLSSLIFVTKVQFWRLLLRVKRRNDRPEIRLPLHPRKRTWTIPCPKMRGVANGVPTEATVCFSRLEPTLHGSPALCLAAGVVVLPLHTRH